MLPEGWRIPTVDDFYDIRQAANRDWKTLTLEEYGGTNELNFNAPFFTPMATDHTSPDLYPYGRDKVTKFIMIPYNGSNEFQLHHPHISEQFGIFGDNGAWRILLRVCKDA